MTFLLGTFARVKPNWAKAGAANKEVEVADALVCELEGGSERRGAVVRLHEDGTETICAPIGLKEGRFVTIVAGEAGAGGDAKLDFIEEGAEFPTFGAM